MGWGCPHEIRWFCQRLRKECRPGQRGCVLQGKVTSFDPNEVLAHGPEGERGQTEGDAGGGGGSPATDERQETPGRLKDWT